MAYRPSNAKHVNAYNRKHYKIIATSIKKEYYSSVILPAAAYTDETVSGFIKAAIAERVERLKSEGLTLPSDGG